MQQATRIVGNQKIGVGLEGRPTLDFTHCRRNHRELYGKSSAETTTGSLVLHFDESQVSNVFQQPPGLLLDAKLTQTVASIMKSNFRRKSAPQVKNSEAVDQEL